MSLYEKIAAIVVDGLVFGSSGAPKLGEISAMLAMSVSTQCRKSGFLAHLRGSKWAQFNTIYAGDVPPHEKLSNVTFVLLVSCSKAPKLDGQ